MRCTASDFSISTLSAHSTFADARHGRTDSVGDPDGDAVAHPLDHLYEHDEQQHNGDEHAGLITVVAVLNGQIANAAGTDGE